MPLTKISDKLTGESVIKQLGGVAIQGSFNDLTTEKIYSSSFMYQQKLGVKSTQQINLDWSSFENHCFFASAEMRVNETINKIINSFPFDGNKQEYERFLSNLTGFEKYVFDQFPTFMGALLFSGSWIEVFDKSGYDDVSADAEGTTVLNPGDSDSFTVETLAFIPEEENSDQIIFQKSNASGSITLGILQCSSSNFTTGVFSVTSGNFINSVTFQIAKGQYIKIAGILDKSKSETHYVRGFADYEETISPYNIFFNKIDMDDTSAILGSGSTFSTLEGNFTPTTTFSGVLDDFRIYHSSRTAFDMIKESTRGAYSNSDMRLYFRFNEPTGTISVNNSNVVLDSSGHSLHSRIINFDESLRTNVTGSTTHPMQHEKQEFKKILFPAFSGVLSLHTTLLSGAREYDQRNPNMIFKLIPQHYFLEGSNFDGVPTNIIQEDSTGGTGPGQNNLGKSQTLVRFLSMWSKYFDELKIFVDAFGKINTVDYDPKESMPDEFLDDYMKESGFVLPKMFSKSGADQFVYGENITGENDSSVSVRNIQSEITRRIAVNLNDIASSKGTQHSIRSFLRAAGIDPDNSLKIREYGGPTIGQITSGKERKMEIFPMLAFSGGISLDTPYLSSSRIEPGIPNIRGTFITSSGILLGSNNPSDGLLTTGSFSIECLFKLPERDQERISISDGSQSLFRLMTTGSSRHTIANILAVPGEDYPETSASIKVYLRSSPTGSAETLSMSLQLPDKGIFDGDAWHISFDRKFSGITDALSSTYTIRAGKFDYDIGCIVYSTSSYFSDTDSVLSVISSTANASGAFIAMSGDAAPSSLSSLFLDDTLNVDDQARFSEFVGRACFLRFWSKSFDDSEWRSHVADPRSTGVSDPKLNYNFNNHSAGSFEKIRMDTLFSKTNLTSSITSELYFPDYSLNNMTCHITGCLSSSQYVFGEVFNYVHLSPSFDEAVSDDKVRIRSLYDTSLSPDEPWVVPTPTYQYENLSLVEPKDDTRLSIEFSLSDSIDRDIITLFSSLDKFNNYLGRPELKYSPDYVDLDVIRDIYFNRHASRPDFRKFLEFYRWFDVSISSFIEQLIPSRTLYKGTNYVVESHMLERHKTMRYDSNSYLRTTSTTRSDDAIRLLQIAGNLKKYLFNVDEHHS